MVRIEILKDAGSRGFSVTHQFSKSTKLDAGYERILSSTFKYTDNELVMNLISKLGLSPKSVIEAAEEMQDRGF